MSAPTQLHALQTLLRKQGLGSALRSVSAKRYPPATTGFAELDDLLGGGIPRGQITELVGKASSGCTSVALSLLAEATARQEIAAYIDASDCFDPPSAERAGVALDRLLWVRCGDKKVPGVRCQGPGGSVHGSRFTDHEAREEVSSRLASTSCPRARHAAPLQQKKHPPRSAVRPINGSTDQRLTVYGSRFTSDKPGRPSTWWLRLEDLAQSSLIWVSFRNGSAGNGRTASGCGFCVQ